MFHDEDERVLDQLRYQEDINKSNRILINKNDRNQIHRKCEFRS